MPYKPVDQAIKIVFGPVISDGDFVTIVSDMVPSDCTVAIMLEGLEGGAGFTSDAITCSDAGSYILAHKTQGYYTLTLPASGGATFNNDTEGVLRGIGRHADVLPFATPAYDIITSDAYNRIVVGGTKFTTSDMLDSVISQISGADGDTLMDLSEQLDSDVTYSQVAKSEATLARSDALAAWGSAVTAASDSLGAWADAVIAKSDALAGWGSAVTAASDATGAWERAALAASEATIAASDALAGWGSSVTAASDALLALTEAQVAASDAGGAWSDISAAASDALGAWGAAVTAASDALLTLVEAQTAASDAGGAWSDISAAASDALGAWSQANVAASDAAGAWSDLSAAASDALGAWGSSVTAASDALLALIEAQTAASDAGGAWSDISAAASDALGAWADAAIAKSEATLARSDAQAGWTSASIAYSEAYLARSDALGGWSSASIAYSEATLSRSDALAGWGNQQTAANAALVALKLDHLIAVSDIDDPVDGSIIAQLGSKGFTPDWSTFDNTTDSLEALRDRGDSAWLTGGGGAATLTYTTTDWTRTIGDNDGGAGADTATVNGTYFATGEINSGNLLEVDAVFTIGDGEVATNIDVWGFYVGGGSHVINVQASDATSGFFEPIGVIGLGTGVQKHSFNLSPSHTNAAEDKVTIKFVHSAGTGITSHVLNIDKAQVNSATPATTVAKMKAYLQLLARKDAFIVTDNATELAELNTDMGSGAGTFAPTSDSIQAVSSTVTLTRSDAVAGWGSAVTAASDALGAWADAVIAKSDALAAWGSAVTAVSDAKGAWGGTEASILAATGLDTVATTEPAGLASTFREMVVQTFRWCFGKSKMTGSDWEFYKEDGSTAAVTVTLSSDSGSQTKGEGA